MGKINAYDKIVMKKKGKKPKKNMENEEICT